MKKLMILTALSISLFSLNTFAANTCDLGGGVVIQNGGTGCSGGSQVSCSNGTVTFDSDAQGNAIACGGIAVPGAAKPRLDPRKSLKK